MEESTLQKVISYLFGLHFEKDAWRYLASQKFSDTLSMGNTLNSWSHVLGQKFIDSERPSFSPFFWTFFRILLQNELYSRLVFFFSFFYLEIRTTSNRPSQIVPKKTGLVVSRQGFPWLSGQTERFSIKDWKRKLGQNLNISWLHFKRGSVQIAATLQYTMFVIFHTKDGWLIIFWLWKKINIWIGNILLIR